MIYFIQRLPGRSDKKDFIGTSETAIRDLVKVLAMGFHPHNANKHWIGTAATSLLDSGRESYGDRPKIYGFLGVSNKNERFRAKGSESLLKNSNESPEDFVERIWNDDALQKDKGILKYPGMMSPNPGKDQILDTLEKLRFIALCLTGQLKPEDYSWDGKALRGPLIFSQPGLIIWEFQNYLGILKKFSCQSVPA